MSSLTQEQIQFLLTPETVSLKDRAIKWLGSRLVRRTVETTVVPDHEVGVPEPTPQIIETPLDFRMSGDEKVTAAKRSGRWQRVEAAQANFRAIETAAAAEQANPTKTATESNTPEISSVENEERPGLKTRQRGEGLVGFKQLGAQDSVAEEAPKLDLAPIALEAHRESQPWSVPADSPIAQKPEAKPVELSNLVKSAAIDIASMPAVVEQATPMHDETKAFMADPLSAPVSGVAPQRELTYERLLAEQAANKIAQ